LSELNYIPRGLLPHQMEFLNSLAPHTGLIGGFGSGKSEAGVIKTIEKKKAYPGIDVAYYLPTVPLIKGIAFKKFKAELTSQGIPYQLHETDKEFKTPFGKIIMRSMENAETIVGYDVGYSLIDEADILPHKKMKLAFKNIIARNRTLLPNGDVNSTDMVSTPEGFKFMYEFFVKRASERRVMIKAKSKDNPFLPASYFETLEEEYTSEQLEAYLNGEFINLNTGNVYHRFNRKEHHSDKQITKGNVLHVGMDFNVTNMNAVIHIIDKAVAYAVAEESGLFDTQQMAERLKATYPGHQIVIYPDASGAAKSTSGPSDIQILKRAGFTVKAPAKNPFVRDRVNAFNLALKDNKQHISYYVNTFNCPVYTEALEQMPYKNGEPDKTSGFDHITEAGGYFIYQFRKQSNYISIK